MTETEERKSVLTYIGYACLFIIIFKIIVIDWLNLKVSKAFYDIYNIVVILCLIYIAFLFIAIIILTIVECKNDYNPTIDPIEHIKNYADAGNTVFAVFNKNYEMIGVFKNKESATLKQQENLSEYKIYTNKDSKLTSWIVYNEPI